MNIIELAKEAGFGNLVSMPWIKGLERFAALVRAEREWVDLTDDEIAELLFNRVHNDPLNDYARRVIAAFKEKNK